MVYSIVWSVEAEASYLKVVDDLLLKWTEREALKFIQHTEAVIAKISVFPYLLS